MRKQKSLPPKTALPPPSFWGLPKNLPPPMSFWGLPKNLPPPMSFWAPAKNLLNNHAQSAARRLPTLTVILSNAKNLGFSLGRSCHAVTDEGGVSPSFRARLTLYSHYCHSARGLCPKPCAPYCHAEPLAKHLFINLPQSAGEESISNNNAHKPLSSAPFYTARQNRKQI